MYYIDALNLTHLAIENNILIKYTQVDSSGEAVTGVLVFFEGIELPELWTEDYFVYSLMGDKEGELALISALERKGVKFDRYEGSNSGKSSKSVRSA